MVEAGETEKGPSLEEIVESCRAELPSTRKGVKLFLKTYLRHTERVLVRLDCLAIMLNASGNQDAAAALAYAAAMVHKAKQMLESALNVI